MSHYTYIMIFCIILYCSALFTIYICLSHFVCVCVMWRWLCVRKGEHEMKCIKSFSAKFFRGNINIYLHRMSFLHTDMPKIIEIVQLCVPIFSMFVFVTFLKGIKSILCYVMLCRIIPGLNLFNIVSIMVADVLVMQGARASATMILT